MGHTHRKHVHTKTIYVPDSRNTKLNVFRQVFVGTGGALEHEESYAEEKGLPPTEKGFVRVILGGRRTDKEKIKEIRVEV